MSKVLTEARSMCPELVDVIKELDNLAYTRRYDTVFSDFIDWLVFQHQYPPSDKNPLNKYNEEEKQRFLNMYQKVQEEVRNRTWLWADKSNDENKGFYDPLGRIYETITSKYKSSMLGQYFTPNHIADFMAQILDTGTRNKFEKILEPAAGSGRIGLAVAIHAQKKGNMVWATMNDIDPICTKMSAINMAFNGVVGETTCMNGLDITGDSYRFGYQIRPILSFIPENQWELYRMAIFTKTHQDVRKQYVLVPIEYENTFLKQANDQVVKNLEERKKIMDEEKRAKAITELENEVKNRLKGSLFENDNSQIKNLPLPSEKPKNRLKVSKKKNKEGGSNQGSLFS